MVFLLIHNNSLIPAPANQQAARPVSRRGRGGRAAADCGRACGLSQRVFHIILAVAAVGQAVGRGGREFYPLQLVAVHQRTGVSAVGEARLFGGELHAHRTHLLPEVEVIEVLHARAVERVAEVAQPLDVDALAHRHACVHHACDVTQHGLHVRVAHCGNLRQILGDGLRFYRLTLHDGLGVVNACRFLK